MTTLADQLLNGADGDFDPRALRAHLEHLRGRYSTAQDLVVEALRQAIFEGILAAGARLRQEQLASIFETSRIPIREALRVLEAEGLVRSGPQRGFTVASIDADQLEELYELRSVLEGHAVRLAVPLLTHADLAELEGLYDEVQKADTAEGRLAKGEEFMLRLFSVTARPELLHLIERLRQRIARPLRSKLVQHAPDHQRTFFEAIRSGDADRAAAELTAHYEKIISLLRRFLREAKHTRKASPR